MFTKDNIEEVRFLNPESTEIEVLYTEEGVTRAFSFPARPMTTKAWKVLKAAGWSLTKVQDATIEWVREQHRMQTRFAIETSMQMAEELKSEIQAEYNKSLDSVISGISGNGGEGDDGGSVYSALTAKNNDSDTVFEFKVALLEDKNNFQGMTKDEEKAKRREIRKSTTMRELVKFINDPAPSE